jgi:hypothetical protein
MGSENTCRSGSPVAPSVCPYELIFGIREARVQLALNRSEKAENKLLFDLLFEQRQAIEAQFGSPLTWKRLENKKSSRIEFAKQFDSYDPEQWEEIINWMIENLRRLHDAVDARLKNAASSLG